MSVRVRIPTVLRPRTGGEAVVTAAGSTVAEVVGSLESLHPGIGSVLLEADGSLKRFVNVFVNNEDVRYLQGLDTPVPDGAEMVILPAVAGGSC
jgi:molybdopterin synthase sulfur carrier subunit